MVPEEVIRCISSMVHVLRSRRAEGGEMEFEARFGNIGNTFDASVNESFVQASLMAMQNFDGWDAVKEWQLETVFYYRLDDGREVRTSRVLCPGEDFEVTHICKEKISKHDFRLMHSNTNFDVHLPTHLRVGLSEETSITLSDLPSKVIPSRVTYKFRKSFTFGNWRYDFTRKLSGVSIADIEAKKSEREPYVWEIEVELLRPHEYLQNNTDSHTAQSLTMKMLNFFPSKNTCVQIK